MTCTPSTKNYPLRPEQRLESSSPFLQTPVVTFLRTLVARTLSAPNAIPARGSLPSSPRLARCHFPVFVLFLGVAGWNLLAWWWPGKVAGGAKWSETAFLLLAALTSLLSLARRLPLQNVAALSLVISVISAAVLAISSLSGIPFGPCTYSELLGGKLFDVLPWSLPVVWLVVLINARGVARLILRPWRKTPAYGLWIIGITAALAVWFDLALEPVAVYVKEYWVWRSAKSIPAWYTAPWINSLGWLVTALAILAFATPWFIVKQPVKSTVDWHPLMVWLTLNSWLAAGNALHQLRPAAVISLAGGAIVAWLAARGARW